MLHLLKGPVEGHISENGGRKSQAPGGDRTDYLLVTRRAPYRVATTAAYTKMSWTSELICDNEWHWVWASHWWLIISQGVISGQQKPARTKVKKDFFRFRPKNGSVWISIEFDSFEDFRKTLAEQTRPSDDKVNKVEDKSVSNKF